jgi:putative peptidoglycan lipid II flippase
MHALLALTNGMGALLNAAWLYVGLRRSNVLYGDSGTRPMIVRIVCASGVMALFLWMFGGQVDAWIGASESSRAARLAGLVAGGAAVYFGALWVFGGRGAHFRLQLPAAPQAATQAATKD